MSTEQNKAVVRRYITDVLAGGQVDLVDELLAANYVNRGMGDMDRAGFKAWLNANSAGPGGRMEIVDLIGEGDAVVARFTYAITLPAGEKVTARGLTYYRLADGRIVEDDPITTPDLTQVFAAQMLPSASPS
jgi:predicted SnoaL-like aldol condensation-catalyzing enzyme